MPVHDALLCATALAQEETTLPKTDSLRFSDRRDTQFSRRGLNACKAVVSAGAIAVALAGVLAVFANATQTAAQAVAHEPIKNRHIDAPRDDANKNPRSEGDQTLVEGWPLYRNERGQAAFNAAMATLKATDGSAPSPQAFKGCERLECSIALPKLTSDGWLQPGRIWVSPTEYVLVAHSPRLREGQSYRRRSNRGMQYFVFHEFHNSSRNTDVYDTAASHKGTVFVPFYMSKSATDAKGRRFVVVVQVAPHDVVSVHATNMGSAGPGIEVARNASDATEPLQNLAGILVATIVKTAAPRLEVVNHRGDEGQPMLEAYERRLSRLKARSGASTVALPFVPAQEPRVATATGRLDDLILRPGASPRIPIAERGFMPPKVAGAAGSKTALPPEPVLVGPIRLATRPAHLRGNGEVRSQNR